MYIIESRKLAVKLHRPQKDAAAVAYGAPHEVRMQGENYTGL